MKIVLTSTAEVLMRAWTFATRNEFSGLADVWRQDGDLYVMNAHVLDVGTFGFTDFTPDMIRTLPPSENRRCWFHRHPITTWSGTDMHTMTYEPCGSIPQMIQWAVAIVWTPVGWLGAMDMFVPTHRHFALEVVSQGTPELVERLAKEYAEENDLFQMSETLRKAFDKRHKKDWYADEAVGPTVRMTADQFHREYDGEWPEETVPFKQSRQRGPSIRHVYRDDAGQDRVPAPVQATKKVKKHKTLVQKMFPWLLDKPKED